MNHKAQSFQMGQTCARPTRFIYFWGENGNFFFLHFFKQLETLGFLILILQKYKSKRLMLDEMNQ